MPLIKLVIAVCVWPVEPLTKDTPTLNDNLLGPNVSVIQRFQDPLSSILHSLFF